MQGRVGREGPYGWGGVGWEVEGGGTDPTVPRRGIRSRTNQTCPPEEQSLPRRCLRSRPRPQTRQQRPPGFETQAPHRDSTPGHPHGPRRHHTWVAPMHTPSTTPTALVSACKGQGSSLTDFQKKGAGARKGTEGERVPQLCVCGRVAPDTRKAIGQIVCTPSPGIRQHTVCFVDLLQSLIIALDGGARVCVCGDGGRSGVGSVEELEGDGATVGVASEVTLPPLSPPPPLISGA